MARKIPATDYPNINKLCDLLNLCLLEDITESEDGLTKSPVFFLAEFEHTLSGIPKQILTPNFTDLADLDVWCLDRCKKVLADGPGFLKERDS